MKNTFVWVAIASLFIMQSCFLHKNTTSTTLSLLQKNDWRLQPLEKYPNPFIFKYEVDKYTAFMNSEIKEYTAENQYYLSDKLEVFDSLKVGKNVNGKYIIGKDYVFEIEKLDSLELVIKNMDNSFIMEFKPVEK